jgi:hypothetical protein
MPFARYFLFVGGALLGLLFVADAYLPKLPGSGIANSDPAPIRIHTDRKWPARVVYDTGLPTVVPTQTAETVTTTVEGPATAANVSGTRAEDAFARLQQSDIQQLRQSELKKPHGTRQRKQRIVKRHAGSRMLMTARLPKFGWFW